ncbi:chorismate mutase [Actinospica sp.]|uniref:chorismate mutase n=1 Tax=Actinospica sp. TaxID=1872142 RepID=UPI002D1CFDE1|nr:chorismate mutase [Actinospica sp.]HWG27969.1 chorismate mutase [Actinospica sp.]
MNTAPAEPVDDVVSTVAAVTAESVDPRAADSADSADSADPADPAAPGGVLGGRERIDAFDAQIIELIRGRMAVSAEIQAARMADGGRRLDLRRETEVIGRYTRELGRPGTTVAMALLELGRGRV